MQYRCIWNKIMDSVGGDSNSKDCNNQVFDCTFTFSFLFSIKVSTIIALAHALKTMTTIKWNYNRLCSNREYKNKYITV